MSATDDAAKARENAMAAVRAIFERYMKLAEKGPYRNGEPDVSFTFWTYFYLIM